MADRLLTTAELAETFPVSDANSERCWYRLLIRWRDQRKLQEGRDVRIVRTGGRVQRVYSITRIARLVASTHHAFCESVRIEHAERLANLLQPADAALPPTMAVVSTLAETATANTPPVTV